MTAGGVVTDSVTIQPAIFMSSSSLLAFFGVQEGSSGLPNQEGALCPFTYLCLFIFCSSKQLICGAQVRKQ